MKRILLAVAVFSLWFPAAAPVFAEQVSYVQSVKAKVMSAASFKSAQVAVVTKGTKLISLGREGNWTKVRIGTTEGYLPSLILASNPPLNRVGLIKGDQDNTFERNVRRRASTFTSAAAARGLAQDDRRRLNAEEKSNYTSLERMESLTISDGDVMKFAEGGKL